MYNKISLVLTLMDYGVVIALNTLLTTIEADVVKYPSGELALSIAMHEYDNEQKRSEIITNKASIFLGLLLATSAYSLDYRVLRNIISNFGGADIFWRLGAMAYVCSVALLFVCLLILLWILKPHGYFSINLRELIDGHIARENTEHYAMVAAIRYGGCYWHNMDINNRRVHWYRISIILVIASFFLWLMWRCLW